MSLLAYPQEQGFPEQGHFCRHRMLQDLGWSAVLVTAIREGWGAPMGRKTVQAKALRQCRVKQRQEAERVEEIAPADEAAFDPWWAGLPEDERDLLTARARAELIGESATLARHYERNPERLREALRPILMRLGAGSPESGGHPPKDGFSRTALHRAPASTDHPPGDIAPPHS